jgi:hypothetical protein
MNALNYEDLQWTKDPKEIVTRYFNWLKRRNPEKYGSYVFGMKYIIPLLLKLPWNLKWADQMLPIMYAACRIIDDVTDGDFPDIPSARSKYVKERLTFILSASTIFPRVPEEFLFARIFDIARTSWKLSEVMEGTGMIVESMLFDAERIEKFQSTRGLSFPECQKLEDHFVLMDILWTGIWLRTLLNLSDDPKILDCMRNIGVACHIEYTLKDLPEDLRAGIVNISKEDAERYGISISELSIVANLPAEGKVDPKNPSLIYYQDPKKYPSWIKNWVIDQTKEYVKLTWTIKPEDVKKLSFVAKFLYRFAYRGPSDKVIQRIKQQFTTHA